MKSERQNIILDIIASKDIETQQQLMNELHARGIKSTQATLSRDINDLNLTKEATGKGERAHYVVSGSARRQADNDRLHRIFKECMVSCETAQNILVIKTLPGLANGACSTLDHMHIDGLVGTIAGDDTAFLAMKDNEAAKRLFKELSEGFNVIGTSH